MRLTVRHVTTYHYESRVSIGHTEARLRPRSEPSQKVIASRISLSPQAEMHATFVDYFGNLADFFVLHAPHRELRLEAASEVWVDAVSPPMPSVTLPWEQVRDLLHAPAIGGAAAPEVLPVEYAFGSPFATPTEVLRRYAEPSFPPGRPILEAALDLQARIHRDHEYVVGSTTVATPLEEVLTRRRGVCQDFAHLAIACLRSMGLAARYVSGYLLTRPPPGQPRRLGADASHAWLSVFCPPVGFVDLDPTNDRCPDDTYVRIAWGRDFGDVSPVKGVILGGGAHTVQVAVDVTTLA